MDDVAEVGALPHLSCGLMLKLGSGFFILVNFCFGGGADFVAVRLFAKNENKASTPNAQGASQAIDLDKIPTAASSGLEAKSDGIIQRKTMKPTQPRMTLTHQGERISRSIPLCFLFLAMARYQVR